MGKSSWAKGRHLSEEHRRKIGDAQRGRNKGIPALWINSDKYKDICRKISEAKKGKPSTRIGHEVTTETRGKISLALSGNKHFFYGKHPSMETRKKMSESKKGDKSYLWQGGITPVNAKIRNSFEMKLWREAVFKRDDYTCVICFIRGGTLNADHIKAFALFPKLRFDVSNGRTLCVSCHRKTDTFSGKTRTKKPLGRRKE